MAAATWPPENGPKLLFFAYSCKHPAYSGAFLLTVDNLGFFTYNFSFLLTILALLLTVGAFLAYNGKVRLIRALKDCEQRSLTVRKKSSNCK